MTRSDAAYLYRRDIALAIATYDKARRDILSRFAGNSDAIQGAFCNIWATCRVAFAAADLALDKRRALCSSVAAINSHLTEECRS